VIIHPVLPALKAVSSSHSDARRDVRSFASITYDGWNHHAFM